MGIRVFSFDINYHEWATNYHQLFLWRSTILIHENSWSIHGHSCSKKKHMRCFLENEQRMHINYMQSKISVIRAIRVQKKFTRICYLLGEEQRMSLYFSEHESHGSHEFRHCMQCQSSNWHISTITFTINSVGGLYSFMKIHE